MPENIIDSPLSIEHSTAASTSSPYELLKSINFPRELRALDERQLKQLATELRAFLLDSDRKSVV